MIEKLPKILYARQYKVFHSARGLQSLNAFLTWHSWTTQIVGFQTYDFFVDCSDAKVLSDAERREQERERNKIAQAEAVQRKEKRQEAKEKKRQQKAQKAEQQFKARLYQTPSFSHRNQSWACSRILPPHFTFISNLDTCYWILLGLKTKQMMPFKTYLGNVLTYAMSP